MAHATKNDINEMEVIAGAPAWTLNGANVFSENLVRELRRRGIRSHILLTEENSMLVDITEARMQRPTDIPLVELPVERRTTWGGHWGAMLRYLEEHAPCIYIPNYDWRHSCICPLLSNRVGVVGVVHSDDPLHYDHVKRLGKYWNMITTTSPTITQKTLALDPDLKDRIVTISIGVDIPFTRPQRQRKINAPLKLIYHGTLKQHQKRILDLPQIMAKVAEKNIPAQLTIAGDGPDGERVREAAQNLVKRGLVQFLGVVARDKIFDLLAAHDVYILASEFEGMPNALLEAMGRGCVPLVTRMESGIPDLVRDGNNGYVVPIGDIEAFAERLDKLQRDPEQFHNMSERSYETVSNGKFRIRDMVEAYVKVFDRVLENAQSGAYQRPAGALEHPPAQVAGVSLLPIALYHEEPGVGAFPTAMLDYSQFERQIRQIPLSQKSPLVHVAEKGRRRDISMREILAPVKVIAASPAWTNNGVNTFCADLVRALLAQGISAEILLTEEDTELVTIDDARLPRPGDIPFQALPVRREESWGAHWGVMIRYLEENAPCIYLPNYDWHHSCISPLLSKRVVIVGILHQDDPLYYDHLARLGQYWNAIISVKPEVTGNIQRQHPDLMRRLAVISHEADRPSDMAQDYIEVFARIMVDARQGIFQRPRGLLQPPPAEVTGVTIFPIELSYRHENLGLFPGKEPDFLDFKEQIRGLPLQLIPAE